MAIQGLLHYQTTGAVGQSIKVNYAAVVAPTVNDDSTQGYAVGSRWRNVARGTLFICTSATPGAAVWVRNAAGPAASTDRAAARHNGTGGNLLSNSSVVISDAGEVNLDAAALLQIGGNRAQGAFSAYDNGNLQTFTTAITVLINTTFFTPNAALYTLASGEVTVKIAGRYMISASCGTQQVAGGGSAECFLEKNGVEITGTRSMSLLIAGTQGTGCIDTRVDLAANDVIRLRVLATGGATGGLPANAAQLTIVRLT